MPNNVHAKSKYHSLITIIREHIAAGELQPGAQIPTLKELCVRYGVSHITVRHAIDLLVSDGTLYRVQGKGTFVSIPSSPLRTIALVIPHLFQIRPDNQYDQSFTAPLVHTIESAAREYNANIMLYLANDEMAKERENLQNVLERRPDGVILFYFGDENNMDLLEQLSASGIPLVLIDRYPPNWPGTFVTTDNYIGACLLTNALIARGFTQIFHLSLRENVSSTTDRLAGYLSVMHSHHLSTDELIYQTATHLHSQEISSTIAQITKEICATAVPPYAFFSTNAQVTEGIWSAVQQANIDPRQVGLACFDRAPINIPPETFYVLAEQPVPDIGKMSVRLVMDQIHGIEGRRRIIFQPTIQAINDIAPRPKLAHIGI